MAGLMERVTACRAIGGGFQKPIFRTLRRALSTSSSGSTSTGDAGAAAEEKPKRMKKKNLFEVAQFLPNWGLGYKLAKSHWRDVSYELTKINLYKDGRHGKAWGIRYKAGLKVADAPLKMSGVNKPGWKYIPESKKKATSTPTSEQTIPVISEQSLA